MEINKNLYSTVLSASVISLFLILFLSVTSAASPTLVETQITTNESAQLYPAIYEDRIVWTDARNGVWDEYGNIANLDIYMYNITTATETQITTNESNQSMPAIYGDRIVWQDERNGNSDIYTYDLSTLKETQITTNKSGQIFPAIYGDRVVWQDERSGIGDIYMYDFSTHKETPITSYNSTIQWEPAIYGDKIVWADLRYGQDEGEACIFMYDISTHKETQITGTGSYDAGSPHIYGDKIVYYNAEMYEIFVYDLSTNKAIQITNNYSSASPAIYGNRIVWWDTRHQASGSSNSDIYMYDLPTSKETQITTNESEQFSPAIYGNRVVWSDTRNGFPKYDIYMCTISGDDTALKPPTSNFTATPASGKAPLKVKFTSTSTESPTAWKWNFGDGSPLSLEQNPEHTYTKSGVYTVKHTAINAAGRDTEIKTKYINVSPVLKAPVAAFSASPRSGKVSLKVQFTDKSANSPTSWKWSFGDGKYSTQKNPAHTYSKAGKYDISLTVKNAKGSSTKKISGYIVVNKK
jgi:beta propeller repeat protein